VTVKNVAMARQSLVEHGCVVIKDEQTFPLLCAGPFGLIYNLTQ